METAVLSPTPKKPAQDGAVRDTNLFNFPSAIRMLLQGNKVSKKEWNDVNVFGELKDAVLMLYIGGAYHPWKISEGDMIGEDFFIV